jgi:hypothetical protein
MVTLIALHVLDPPSAAATSSVASPPPLPPELNDRNRDGRNELLSDLNEPLLLPPESMPSVVPDLNEEYQPR